MDLNLVKIFAKLSQLGSFTQAATSLNMPKSRVSRAISRLEEELGVQLVRRTTRQVTLTPAGQKLYQETGRLIFQLEQELHDLSGLSEKVAGVLKITAPEDMAQAILPGILQHFIEQYPQVKIQTVITNEYIDLVKENIDVAFRIGRLPDSNLIGKRIGSAGLLLVASNDYLSKYGRPKKLVALKQHNFIPFKVWQKNPQLKELKLSPTLVGDSFSLLLNLALTGTGITMLPDFFAKKYLESGELERVIPNWKAQSSPLHLVYPPAKRLPPQLRAFIDVVAEEFKSGMN